MFHFCSLLLVSFLNVVYLGPHWCIVLSWLMLGATLAAIVTTVIKQIKKRSFFGNYFSLNVWLGFHTFVQVIWANLSPVVGGEVGNIMFVTSIFFFLPILYIT